MISDQKNSERFEEFKDSLNENNENEQMVDDYFSYLDQILQKKK